MANEHAFQESFVDELMSEEHRKQLRIEHADLATVVTLHGEYQPGLELIMDVDREEFIRKCDEKYPGPEGEPQWIGKVRANVFLPVTKDRFLFVGQ